MRMCAGCGRRLAFCRLKNRHYQLSAGGLFVRAECSSCGESVNRRTWFPLIALGAALVFVLVQLRVVDLTVLFARTGVAESTGEALVLVGLGALVALSACRVS